jgi:hypothetical protein
MNYDAPPTIGRFLGCEDPVRLVVGPVGSGKSSGCCIEILRRATETPPGPDGIRRSRWAVVRNTYPELRDTTIKTFKEWVPEPLFGSWWQSEHTFELNFETEDGAKVQGEVMFRALDRPADVKKLLSLELTGCYFNETKEIPRSVFDMMQTRVGRYPRKEDVSRYWSGVFGDTNPMDTDHYLYRLFEEEKPDGYRIFKQPGGRSKNAENIKNLDRCFDVDASLTGEARELAKKEQDELLAQGKHEPLCRCYYAKNSRGKKKDYIKVYIDGEYGFVQEGKPVYDEFQDSIHVQDVALLPGCTKLTIGNDFGLTPAAVWCQQDPSDGQWQIIREHVAESMGAVRFGKDQHHICKTEFRTVKHFEGWGDPAGMARAQTDENTPIDVIESQGVPMRAAPTNDYMRRREAVAGLLTRLTRLGRPALVISPKCVVLRKGMAGGYCFRRLQVTGDDRYEDHPLKNHFSHVCEALQYAMVGAGEDYTALEGGQERQVSVNVRVHLQSGGTVMPISRDENRPIRVLRNTRRG